MPIVFATYPLLAGIEKADMIFNIVFFIAVTSVLFQGTTIAIVAKWLRVDLPLQAKPIIMHDNPAIEIPKTVMRKFQINPGCPVVQKQIVDIGFPETVTIALIKRNNEYLTPTGATIIEAGDSLVVLATNQEGLGEVEDCLGTEITI